MLMNAFLKESHSSNLSSNEGIGPSDNFRRLLTAVASDKLSTSFVARRSATKTRRIWIEYIFDPLPARK